jgi:hypothetical protein
MATLPFYGYVNFIQWDDNYTFRKNVGWEENFKLERGRF